MFQVVYNDFIFGTNVISYLGDNWIAALQAYFKLVQRNEHVFISENGLPARLFSPGIGHVL